MVGRTGAGKTTNLNIYTGNELATGVSAQSITEKTIAVKDKIHPDGPVWIDAPGEFSDKFPLFCFIHLHFHQH